MASVIFSDTRSVCIRHEDSDSYLCVKRDDNNNGKNYITTTTLSEDNRHEVVFELYSYTVAMQTRGKAIVFAHPATTTCMEAAGGTLLLREMKNGLSSLGQVDTADSRFFFWESSGDGEDDRKFRPYQGTLYVTVSENGVVSLQEDSHKNLKNLFTIIYLDEVDVFSSNSV